MIRGLVLAAWSAAAAATASEGPCDILAAAGNPCVAAHSTVRALYANYDGPLYTITHANGKVAKVRPLKPGGFANVTQHEELCPTVGVCVIENVIDQSPHANHLRKRHELVDASMHKIIVGDDTSVYGMYFDPGYGYHVDETKGIATGNDPESMYAVMTGKRYNGKCCFDYGNSETDDLDDGCGTMEAIYFGNAHWYGNSGDGDTGPWVGADLEQGMYYGGGAVTKINHQSKPLTFDFVSLSLKGHENGFTLKGGDAASGSMATMYDGPRPDRDIAGTCSGSDSYQPMRKRGAIILASGGDYSNSAEGNFYEGFMASGYASDATDEALQANIAAVGYKFVDWLSGYTDLGGDCFGNDIASYAASTANECAQRCEAAAGCAGFSYAVTGGGAQCYTKSASCYQIDSADGYKFYRRDAGKAGFDWLLGYAHLGGDCFGNDMDSYSASTANDCAQRCEVTAGCAGFSYSISGGGAKCYTKRASCTNPDKSDGYEFYRRNDGPAGIVWLSGYTSLGGDCFGNDMNAYDAKTANDCAAHCEGTPDCAGFSYAISGGGAKCYTKRASCTNLDKSDGYEFYRRDAGPTGMAASAPSAVHRLEATDRLFVV